LAIDRRQPWDPTDEATYLAQASWIASKGLSSYPELVADHLADPAHGTLPSPLRWGWILLAAGWCSVSGASFASLAHLSTLASILVLLVGTGLGYRLGGTRAALLSAALLGTSALGLSEGRRAMADETWALVAVGAVWAWVDALASTGTRRTVLVGGAVVLLAAQTALKEQGLFLCAALLVALVVVRRQDLLRGTAVVVASLALYGVGLSILAHDPLVFPRLLSFQHDAAATNAWAATWQRGAPWALFPLWAVVSPAAVAGAVVLPVVARRRGPEGLFLTVCFTWVVLIALTGWAFDLVNLRFALGTEVLGRVLAAVWLGRRDLRLAVGLCAASGAVDVYVARTVFLEGGVFDPVAAPIWATLGL
jgi:hypothetical protein